MAIPGSLPRRRFLALGGGIAAAAGLSACGSNTGRPSGGSSSGGSGPALSQWYHEYGEDGVQEAVKKYAAAYTAAQVSVAWKAGDYEKLVGAALLTADVPDVFEYGNGPTLDMIKSGQAVDLTDTLGSAASSFSQPVLDAASWQGKVYAIPQTVDMQMLYYRTSILSKAGVEPPKTMAELTTAAKAVTTKDRGGFFAGNDGGVGVLANMLIWGAGQEQINADQTGIGFDNSDGYAALTAFRQLRASGGLLASASKDWFDAAPFTNEETAMQWGGLWMLPDIQKAFGDDFGVLPFPSIGSGGKQAVPFGAFGSAVAAKGKNVDAAKAFVKWLWVDQTADQVDFSNSYGTHIPARPELVSQATKIADGPGKQAAGFVDSLGKAPDKLWTSAISNAFAAAVTNVAVKNADPKDQIATVAATAKSEIKRVNG